MSLTLCSRMTASSSKRSVIHISHTKPAVCSECTFHHASFGTSSRCNGNHGIRSAVSVPGRFTWLVLAGIPFTLVALVWRILLFTWLKGTSRRPAVSVSQPTHSSCSRVPTPVQASYEAGWSSSESSPESPPQETLEGSSWKTMSLSDEKSALFGAQDAAVLASEQDVSLPLYP